MSHVTDAQILVLRTAILNEVDAEFVGYRNNGQTGQMANWFNKDSTFVVWKTSVPISEIGDNIKATAITSLTALKLQRLQALTGDLSGGFVNPSIQDRRDGFDQVFDGTGADATTRTQLAALWKRFAKRGERLFATGTGTNVSPGNLVFEGFIDDYDISRALA